MIQRVVTGSSRLRKYVPMGTPISAPNTMIAVALRSAFLHAFGSSGAAATKSMIRSSAATSRGSAMLLASGMKISAEPNPEKPRAVPETKAIAQIAIAALMLTSGGMKPAGLMLCFLDATLSENRIHGFRHHARNVPPVFFVTSATIFAATASISWSVSVFSRGWIVTAMATDFLPASMPLPS